VGSFFNTGSNLGAKIGAETATAAAPAAGAGAGSAAEEGEGEEEGEEEEEGEGEGEALDANALLPLRPAGVPGAGTPTFDTVLSFFGVACVFVRAFFFGGCALFFGRCAFRFRGTAFFLFLFGDGCCAAAGVAVAVLEFAADGEDVAVAVCGRPPLEAALSTSSKAQSEPHNAAAWLNSHAAA